MPLIRTSTALMQRLAHIHHAAMLVLVLVGITGVMADISWNAYSHDRYYKKLAVELLAEEMSGSGEERDPPTPSAADSYVNNFDNFTTVQMGYDGFEPAAVTIKPMTKVIFKSSDDKAHFLHVSAGSITPKHFDPQDDITKNSLFQTKFEEPGTYHFYDAYNPAHLLSVTVTQ